MTSIILALLIGSCEFPMDATGSLSGYSFFQQDEAHFVYGRIHNTTRILRCGRFSTLVGMDFTTYMGKNLNNPEMKFNIYGGHWNLSLELQWAFSEMLLARLYTDHECFHNIDMPDTSSEYMNNVKLGVAWEEGPAWAPVDGAVALLPVRWPSGWFSVGTYLPKGASFQKGHDFRWSYHLGLDVPLAEWRSLRAGSRYDWDVFFTESRDGSSRHRLEVYTGYRAGERSWFELFYAAWPRDTQPFRRLNGRTCWGIRFTW
ncbi:hypothetical protein GF402_09590 [Candidatus Fermentibacteria bacterium]|nr:hypothetical protein [Candidatus Fermentibacteria bacterium]